MSLCVMLSIFFSFSCINFGITLPLLPVTLPYLTTENLVLLFPAMLLAAIKSLSAQSLVAPYKLIGEEALSVDKSITFFELASIAADIL